MNSPYDREPVRPYRDGDWREDALCRQTDPDAFFPHVGQNATTAKRTCARCPARAKCRAWALENPGATDGIAGGLTERERGARRAKLTRAAR